MSIFIITCILTSIFKNSKKVDKPVVNINPDSKSTNKIFETELEQSEKNSQKMVDDKIITVGSGLLGLTVGFINTIKSTVQANLLSKILFFSVVISLSITIVYSIYSHQYSAIIHRKINENLNQDLHPDFDIIKANKRIGQLNTIQLFGFILTIVFMTLLIFIISSININNSIWVGKSIIFSIYCFIITAIYYYIKSHIKNLCMRTVVNIILIIIFMKGSFLIWLIKQTNPVIQILLS